MCSTLKNMGSDHSLADNDFWLKKDTKSDVTFNYSYILVYVDDILILSEDPKVCMESLSKRYYAKESSIGTPDLYLGTWYKLVIGRSDNLVWSSGTDVYVKEATSIVFKRMEAMGLRLTKKYKSPEHPFSNVAFLA